MIPQMNNNNIRITKNKDIITINVLGYLLKCSYPTRCRPRKLADNPDTPPLNYIFTLSLSYATKQLYWIYEFLICVEVLETFKLKFNLCMEKVSNCILEPNRKVCITEVI
jgi:hypothetical protein